MEPGTKAKSGLTLVEVLVAMVILSVGVSSMMVAMSRCLAVVRTARNRETARSLVRRVDIENPIEPKEIDERSDSGTIEGYAGHTWIRRIEMVDKEDRPGLFLVNTRVQWSERGRDAFEETTTFRYVPDAESVAREL